MKKFNYSRADELLEKLRKLDYSVDLDKQLGKDKFYAIRSSDGRCLYVINVWGSFGDALYGEYSAATAKRNVPEIATQLDEVKALIQEYV